jgi:hypothetical protein
MAQRETAHTIETARGDTRRHENMVASETRTVAMETSVPLVLFNVVEPHQRLNDIRAHVNAKGGRDILQRRDTPQ